MLFCSSEKESALLSDFNTKLVFFKVFDSGFRFQMRNEPFDLAVFIKFQLF